MEERFVYSFNEGSKDMKDILGIKGASLVEMTQIGLRVPFGFTVTTEACRKFYENDETICRVLRDDIRLKIEELEGVMERQFGDPEDPLLVSVRSSSPEPIPGLMDTVLNLGLNDETVIGLAETSGNALFAYNSYLKFIRMFGTRVLNIDDECFADADRQDLTDFVDPFLTDELRKRIWDYKMVIRETAGTEIPDDPMEQLFMAVAAVFRSWRNENAAMFRKQNGISREYGATAIIQAIVFGNKGMDSGTGIAFTRNPKTGEPEVSGKILFNAQGDSLTSDDWTPEPIESLKRRLPGTFNNFVHVCEVLEKHYTDMQEIEFSIENEKLYLLQTRDARRSAQAAVKIAVDMVEEEIIDRKTAILRMTPEHIEHLLFPHFDPEENYDAMLIGSGYPAAPGSATGQIALDPDDAAVRKMDGQRVILVRRDAATEDVEGIYSADGILTARGGSSLHTAVVARSMGKCCITNCRDLVIDDHEKRIYFGGREYRPGDWISLNGTKGLIYDGRIRTIEPDLSGYFSKIMSWADEYRTMKVRTNADTPADAVHAAELGAEGIGLCRTEHMFFDQNSIHTFRTMIFAQSEEERRKALARLLPKQRQDFKGIYRAMRDNPVNIRLLDPPLHAFLPETESEMHRIAEAIGLTVNDIKMEAASIRESNPVLGNRGCRLAVTYPEIAEMQTEAIISAAIEVNLELGIEIEPEIMIPFVSSEKELEAVRNTVVSTAERVMKERNSKIDYQVGSMIEVPRAAIIADDLARHAEFFSLGTNDLTQMTYGFSENDTEELIEDYIRLGVLESNPFKTLDCEGVGRLIKMSVEKGRRSRSNIKIGLCGEQSGDPTSVEFCHAIGINYISCSPYRVPIARLAAAQAAIRSEDWF